MTPAHRRSGTRAALALFAVALAGGTPGAQETKMKQPPGGAAARKASPATVLLSSPNSPLVTFRIQVHAGSARDPKGKEGLNALTALTVGQGGTKDLTFRELTERLFPMAATIDAQPDREVTTFIGKVHRDHLKEFYGLLTGLLLRPRFDPNDFGRNRDLLLAGIETNLRSNDDEELGKEALNFMMYEGQPYGHPNSGTAQGLKSITLDDVKAYYRANYTRGNVVLGVAGGYPQPLAQDLQTAFAALPADDPGPLTLPPPRAIKGVEVLLVDKPTPAPAISIGFPIDVTRSDKDFCALLVANSYLGEHRTFNGRLMNAMRGDRALNYGDYSYIENFIEDGGSTFPLPNIPRRRQHFSIWIRPVNPANALFALRQAVRELKRLVDVGLTGQEFEQTRKYLINYSRLWSQSLSRRLGYLLDARFYGTPPFVDRAQEQLQALTVTDVNAAVKKHLTAKDLDVAIVTDRAQEMRDLLLSGKPTPISYQTPTTRDDLLKEDKEIEAFPLGIAAERVRVVRAQDLFER